MEVILLWIFYILTFYAFLPGIISRLFGFRVFKKGSSSKSIALTFDDGPDPVYTPQLLDLLKKHNAKATFFVVGVQAEQHPELLRRMHEEGHLIGMHNYVHKSNWMMRPKTVKQQISQTSAIIEQITGKPAIYYRPPWGVVNFFDFGNLGHIQIILWSAMFGDWRKKVGAERLYKRMKKHCTPGEVLLLHDCGVTLGADEEAPANMLIALERFLQDADAKGLKCVRTDELIRETDVYRANNPSMMKKMIVGLWLGYERVFHLVFGMKTTNEEDPVFHFRFRPYHGDPIQLDDGVTLNSGDQVMEIHFDNERLYEIGKKSRSSMQLAIHMIRDVERTLPEMAAYIQQHGNLSQEVKAVYGVSFINRGPEQFGFTVRDLPKGLFLRVTTYYLRVLMRVMHPMGQRRLRQHPEQLVPRTIVMSTETLLNRYGQIYMNDADLLEDNGYIRDSRVDEAPHAL